MIQTDLLTEGIAQDHPLLPTLEAMLTQRADLYCALLKLPEDIELSIVLCGDAEIQALNAQWRQEDSPTDVLSFPMVEDWDDFGPGMPLGDIVISVEYAQRLAQTTTHRARVAHELGVPVEALAWSLEREIEFLFIHGLLHLVGHDHAEPEEEAQMKAEERRLWLHGHPDEDA